MTPTQTATTSQVRDYLARQDVQPHVIRLVRAWNNQGLLGIDLADRLQHLVTRARVPIDSSIDWNEIAEDLAEQICGVDEDELTRRRLKFQQSLRTR